MPVSPQPSPLPEWDQEACQSAPDPRPVPEQGDPQGEYSEFGEYHRTDEYDLPAEVDASVRVVRRVAVGYFAVFLTVVLAVPGLTVALDWWSQGRVLGGMSPYFVMAAVGLYVFFFVLAIAAATLTNAVEQRMLGGTGHGNEAAGSEGS